MGSVILALRFVLAGVFATAGIAKLLDRDGSGSSLRDFGLPERAVAATTLLLPAAEIATAVALVPRSSAQWGGIAAAVLLLAFMAGIANAMRRGEAPDCHCFGQLHSAPAGRETLMRNAALAAAALVVAFGGPGPSISAWVEARTAAELAAVGLGAAAVALALFALRLRGEKDRLNRVVAELDNELAAFPPGLPAGAVAPGFSLPSLDGGNMSLDSLRARGRPVALFFVSPGCPACEPLYGELGAWQQTLSNQITIAVVSTGRREENLAVRTAGTVVLLQEQTEVMTKYRVSATPTAVLVTPDGRVGSPPVGGSITTEALVRLALRRQHEPGPVPAGTEASAA